MGDNVIIVGGDVVTPGNAFFHVLTKDGKDFSSTLKLEGTYLVWVDIRKSGLKSDVLAEKLLHDGKVQVNSGMMYGKTAGENYIRINIACTRATLQEGLKRIIKVLSHL